MFYCLSCITMSGVVMAALMIVCKLIAHTKSKEREKLSPFECGFDPIKSSRLPFSIQFFLITILFLIFDVEAVIIVPMMITMTNTPVIMWMTSASIMITILLTGLLYEWKMGALSWTK